MLEIPFNFILINPAVDIFLFLFISYFFVYRVYKSLIKTNYQKIAWIDLKVLLIFFILAYLNYSGQSILIFGSEISWLSYLILGTIIIEIFYILIYWKDTKEYWKKINKNDKK